MSILQKLSVITAGAAIVVGTVGKAQAIAIISSTGISNPNNTVTFSEFTPPTPPPNTGSASITNQYASFGVTFSPNLFYRSASPANVPNQSGPSLRNFNTNPSAGTTTIFDPFSVLFTTPQTSAAFSYAPTGGVLSATTFTALLNGVTVESFTTSTSTAATNNFYGFTGTSSFNEIEVFSSLAAAGDGSINSSIDNIQLGSATPVPFEFSPGLGLLALGAWGAISQLTNKVRNRKSSAFSNIASN